MYTYKRFKTSKSVLTIVLIVLALVAWASLGYAIKPDKPKKPDRSGRNYPHDLSVIVRFSDRDDDQVQSDSGDPYIDGESHVWAILGRRFGVFALKTDTRNKPKPGSRKVSLDFSGGIVPGSGEGPPSGFPTGQLSTKVFIRTSRPDEDNPSQYDRYQYDLRAMPGGSTLEAVPLLIQFKLEESLVGEDVWQLRFGNVTVPYGCLECEDGTPVKVTRSVGDNPDEGIWEIETPSGSSACLSSLGWADLKSYYARYEMSFKLTVATPGLAGSLAPPALNLRSGLTSTWGAIKIGR